MPKGVFIVHTEVDEAQERAFNRWYDDVHLPDMLSLPSVSGASRYRLQGNGPSILALDGTLCTPNYLTIYSLETDSRDVLLGEHAAARGAWVRDGRLFRGHRSFTPAVYARLFGTEP